MEAHVAKELAEKLASEVGCPACGKQLSIRDVTELSRDADGKRPGVGAGAVASPGSKRHKSAAGGASAASSAARPVGQVVGSAAATKRLMKELQAIQRSGDSSQGISGSCDSYTYMGMYRYMYIYRYTDVCVRACVCECERVRV